jgi:hypothetical protein
MFSSDVDAHGQQACKLVDGDLGPFPTITALLHITRIAIVLPPVEHSNPQQGELFGQATSQIEVPPSASGENTRDSYVWPLGKHCPQPLLLPRRWQAPPVMIITKG